MKRDVTIRSTSTGSMVSIICWMSGSKEGRGGFGLSCDGSATGHQSPGSTVTSNGPVCRERERKEWVSMEQTILVTGSTSGFGRLTVETLARQGYIVFAGMRAAAGKNAPAAAELRTLAEQEHLALHIVE